jgi:hypothetical protein
VYAADIKAAKSDSERMERLEQNLRCACEIYQQRVSADGPAAAALLGEEISAASAQQTHFARELASAAAKTNIGFDMAAIANAAQAS